MMQETDLDKILATRHDNGADYWATSDGQLGIERPISTLSALRIMSELRVDKTHEALVGAAQLVFRAIRDDGRVRIYRTGSIYPCHMARAAVALCSNGYAGDKRIAPLLEWLLSNRYEDGGWRCNKFFFGRGPETDFSNPGVTLMALDALRCAGMQEGPADLDTAVETLLNHWTVRAPTGPCHYGIGTLFMQVEYPFLRYNLFYYVYVLSFYSKARKDARFVEAFETLRRKLDNNKMIVERPHRKLENLDICRKGEPSEAATVRYREIIGNLES